MRRISLVGIVSCVAIASSACTTLRPLHLDTAKACADWRWIGISRPEVPCPDVPGWAVRPLFAQLAPVRSESEDYCSREGSRNDYCEVRAFEKVPGPELIREMNRFCVYEIADPHKRLQDLPFPPTASSGLVRFDKDCAALSLADTELYAEDWKSDSEDSHSHAGQPETPIKIDSPLGVRLAFLDTQPTGGRFPETSGTSPHGYSLAHLARKLVCTSEPESRCAAQITTQLALPIIDFDPQSPKHNKTDWVRGGYLGMQSDLAQAIWREVGSWRQEKSQRHLVLNLSLAWDGNLFGGLGEEWIADMKAGTQAVYRALQYANGFDVLVLAAAGNQKCEPCENDGPLLPAAWEGDAPQEQDCLSERRDKPLLYAVGGVESDGSPLANARPRGMPRLAAYGETAMVTSPDSNPERIYSGSSVSTAVVSAIAAAYWNRFPNLDSRDVMEDLYASGEGLPLPYRADFGFSGGAASAAPVMVHRLSLCRALGMTCPAPPSSFRASGPRANRTWAQGSCQPFLLPQPEDPPCPTCPPRN